MDTKKILEQLLAGRVPQGQTDVKVGQVVTSVSSEVTRTVLNEVGLPEKVSEVVTPDTQGVVETKTLKKPTCYVSVEFGANINLGDYNMGKVRVGITVPTGVEISEEMKKEIDQAYLFANKWVQARTDQEVKKLGAVRGR